MKALASGNFEVRNQEYGIVTAEEPLQSVAEPLPERTAHPVVLADGSQRSLQGLTTGQLHRMQWEQEQQFAQQIQCAPKGSRERNVVTCRAYDTICSIVAELRADRAGPLVMGLNQRDVQFVGRLLARQRRRDFDRPSLFEVGYGSGVLLKQVQELGFRVSGVEVSHTMREQALCLLGSEFSDRLLLGSLTDLSPQSISDKPSLIYWNDVFEHISPDEILDYLQGIYRLLAPGGSLVTITPNWLLRPMDVTRDFCPPRTTARGLHLKEYRLREVVGLLHQAGFVHVTTPLLVTRSRVFIAGHGLRSWKQIAEPWLDRLPVGLAHRACNVLGLSYTIASRGS